MQALAQIATLAQSNTDADSGIQKRCGGLGNLACFRRTCAWAEEPEAMVQVLERNYICERKQGSRSSIRIRISNGGTGQVVNGW